MMNGDNQLSSITRNELKINVEWRQWPVDKKQALINVELRYLPDDKKRAKINVKWRRQETGDVKLFFVLFSFLTSHLAYRLVIIQHVVWFFRNRPSVLLFVWLLFEQVKRGIISWTIFAACRIKNKWNRIESQLKNGPVPGLAHILTHSVSWERPPRLSDSCPALKVWSLLVTEWRWRQIDNNLKGK